MEPRSDCLERAITISSVRRVIFFFDVEFRARFYSLSFWFSWDQFSATMELLHTERVNDCFRCVDVLFDAPIQEHVSTFFFFWTLATKPKLFIWVNPTFARNGWAYIGRTFPYTITIETICATQILTKTKQMCSVQLKGKQQKKKTKWIW